MSSTRGDAVKMEREEAGATPRASKLSTAHADVQIPLASLPQYVQEQLAEFDTDGNGIISLAEILRHGAELQHSKRSVTAYRRVIVLLLFVWAASIAAIFGVVTAGVAITRQTDVGAQRVAGDDDARRLDCADAGGAGDAGHVVGSA